MSRDDEGNLLVNGTELLRPDIPADNGVVHVVSDLLVKEGPGGDSEDRDDSRDIEGEEETESAEQDDDRRG